MAQKEFKGDKKKGTTGLLWKPEQKFIKWVVPRIPGFIQSYHLTLAGILWSIGIVLFSFLAKSNIAWLWGASIMLVLHWVTDSIDGALGKYRKMGLAKWGFYMDHFLDYVFFCSILIGYSFLSPLNFIYMLFFILVLLGGFYVNTYVTFAVTDEFRMHYSRIGPTEMRIVFIAINTLLIFFGKTYMARALPYALVISFLGLVYIVYKTQRKIWQIDKKKNMDRVKGKREKN